MNALIVIFFLSYFIYALMNKITFVLIYLILIGLYHYFTHIKYFKNAFNSIRVKTCIGTWGAHTDPQTYVKIKLNFAKTEKYLEEKSKEIGEKVSLTVFVIKLISIALTKFPDLNGYIRFGRVFIFYSV